MILAIILILSYHTVDPANVSFIQLPFEAHPGRGEVKEQTSDCTSHAARTKPFITPLTRGFPPGSRLVIKGTPTDGPVYWFSIDLLPEPGSLRDIALHINGRLMEGKSVLNWKQNCSWGPEQPGPSSFKRLIPFSMVITATETTFKIQVNSSEREFELLRPAYSNGIQELRINGAIMAAITEYEAPQRLGVTELRAVLEEGDTILKQGGGRPPADLPTGLSDFVEMMEEHKTIVDKTGWIAKALRGNPFKLITRPRRFGKSTNLSMLKYFLQKDPVLESKELLKDFEIVKNPEYNNIRSEHQHKYAVFSFSFLGVGNLRHPLDFQKSLAQYVGEVLEQYLNQYQQYIEPLRRLLAIENIRRYPPVRMRTHLGVFRTLISNLTANGYKIAILIDEYDSPFNRAIEREVAVCNEGGFSGKSEIYDEVEEEMRIFFIYFLRNGLISPPDLGIMTGISYIAFSDLSNFHAYTVVDDDYFSPFFGFTGDEVVQLLQTTKSSMKYEDFKDWYYGYHFGESVIFNPYAVVEAIHATRFDVFWGKSGSISVIKELVACGGIPAMLDLHFLVSGYSLEKKIKGDLIFKTPLESEGSYWTLLAHAGYVDATKTDREGIYKLKLPNKELKKYLMMNFESELNHTKRKYDSFLDALKQNHTDSNIQNYLDLRFNSPSHVYHRNINESIESFGEDLKSLLNGFEPQNISSGMFNMNRKPIYQLIVIKKGTIFMFNLAKEDAMPADSASDEVTKVMNLPPAKEHLSLLKNFMDSRLVKIGILFFRKVGEGINKEINEILAKRVANETVRSFLGHHFPDIFV